MRDLTLHRIILLQKWVINFAIIISLAGLIFLAYLGIYNRYWSDDWCYNTDFENLGIGGTVNTYFMTGESALRGYSTNRYSLTLLSGLLFSTGIFGAQITATLVILGWMAGLFWVLNNLAKIYGFPSKPILVLGAVNLLYFTLYLSPQRFQTLYWMAGIYYSVSIITGLYLAGLVTHQIVHETRSRVVDYVTLPLAFLAGGFSETGCVYLISSVSLALLVTFYWRQKRAAWALKAFPTLLLIFLGLAGSLAALVLSPSNAARLDTFNVERTALLNTLLKSLRFSYDFMLDSLKSLPLPHLVFVVSFLSLAVVGVFGTSHVRWPLWKILLVVFIVAFIVWLLIAALQAPTVYVYNSPPDPRGRSLARFTMLVGLAVISWLIGRSVQIGKHERLLTLLALFGLVLGSLYTSRAVLRTVEELPGFVERARIWDERDQNIRRARQQGMTRLEVVVIDMKEVGTRDIMHSVQMNGWTTSCASRYYGLEEIKAIHP